MTSTKGSPALKKKLAAGRLGSGLARAQGCRALKKPGGLHVVEPSPTDLRRRVREGFTFLPYSLDTRMLDTTCRAGLEAVRRKR